ncbi:MAG: AAA family ATPase [Alphaproteobacteria bacterium]|nr:AAA family ATPase [Alphaproteobacteria bacterium]
MKLVNFSVENFRSITNAYRVDISQTTIIIGKNNEGKSNLLKALAIAMNAIISHAHDKKFRPTPISRQRYLHRKSEQTYDWVRDYPVSEQDNENGFSEFRLEFHLEDREVNEFYQAVKSSLNGTLPIIVKIGKDGAPVVRVSKRGKGSKTLNERSDKITDFIAQRIAFNYIPAVRTEREAKSEIDRMLSEALEKLEEQDEYKTALKKIADIQKPALAELGKKIKEPLSEFLPGLKSVKIVVSEESRRLSYRRDFDVIIDDGTATNIEYKGDGIKSLATLGLLKNKAFRKGASIIAIEEPESHLHSGAIHQLNAIIRSLGEDNQVVLTTHNPVFVDRLDISSNILVEGGRASKATNISEIRALLGVRVSDNLSNASFCLLVEGPTDKRIISSIFAASSSILARAINEGLLVIDMMNGTKNLPYKLDLWLHSLCTCYVLLDNDKDGQKAASEIAKDLRTKEMIKNITLTTHSERPIAEIEDMISFGLYAQELNNKYNISMTETGFDRNKKWSENLKQSFLSVGRPWNDTIKNEAKDLVMHCVEAKPKNALNTNATPITTLIKTLEAALEKIAAS